MLFSSDEFVANLKAVSESALDRWAKSFDGSLNDELLGYIKQRIRTIFAGIDLDFKAECSFSQEIVPGEELLSQVLSFDKSKYPALREGLIAAFKEETKLLDLSPWDKQLLGSQAELMVRVVEDSIAVGLMPALFNQTREIELERQHVARMLREIHVLLERDRQRLAFDLHDGPAQIISSAILQADILEDLVGSIEARRELESLKKILARCLHELRVAIYSLRPQGDTKNGLDSRLKEYVKQFSSKTGIKVDLYIRSKEREVSVDIQVGMFRIIQESLNNIYRHAQATYASIDISFGDLGITCSIKDNGIGFNAKKQDLQVTELGGYGLVSMRDRVEQFSGAFEINSTPGKGTCVSFSIPL